MNNGLTEYIKGYLYPKTFNYIDSIFPEMDFILRGSTWVSPKNIDGSEPSHRRPDKSVVRERIPYRVIENGGGGSYDLIDEYKLLNNCSTWEAVRDIANIVGAELPDMDQEQKEKWKEQQRQQAQFEKSLKTQADALFTEQGKATLDYLHGRGWTDTEIRKAELGFISKDEAESLGLKGGIGTDFTLAIPLRSCGWLGGFKYRTIDPIVAENKGKYRNPTGNSRGAFGLTGVQKEDGEVVIVEGEMDALRAQANDLTNVIASMGGGLTDELAKAVKDKGLKHVTLLLDSDDSGEGFINNSIRAAQRYGLRCFVARVPEGKDVDEYIGKYHHSIDELRTVISSAQIASTYEFDRLLTEFERTSANGGEEVKDKEFYALQDKVIQLANHAPSETERDMILSMFVNCIGGQTITKEALQAVADRERIAEDTSRQKRETAKAIKEIAALSDSGDTAAALKKMGEASRSLSSINKNEKYSRLLLPQREVDIRNRMRSKQDSILTPYVFHNPYNLEEEQLYLPCGAITFICAPTSHGKSTFLQNLALQVAQNSDSGDVLYFTFEEDEDSVILQMLNKFIGERLSSHNIRSITSLWRRGTDQYITGDSAEAYYSGERRFFTELIESSKLRVIYEDYDSTELIEAIESYHRNRKVKAVFIDYIQLLNKNGNRKQRTEELKEICKDLKDLSIKTQLPIIVAAQLNRETKSPLDLHSQNIAEAADLERIANKIICLWNSDFKAQKSGDIKKQLEDWEKDTCITLGQGGKIYAKMTKNRGGMVGIEAVLEYRKNEGVIVPNYVKSSQNEQTAQQQSTVMEMPKFTRGRGRTTTTKKDQNPRTGQQQLFNSGNSDSDCPF